MAMHDVDGLNSGYARLLLDEYLENPDAVSAEWRALFESGESDLIATLPGLERLLETARNGNGAANGHAVPAPPLQEGPDLELLAGVAAAVALVKTHRMHGHLAAHLDPLGAEPVGDPALDPLRHDPPLTLELQARIPSSL